MELTTTDHPDALAFIQNPDAAALQQVLAEGNIAGLSTTQRLQFLASICRSMGLNPLTSPFEFISLNGKMRIYAKKDCTEQLRKIHSVSVEILEREWTNDLYIVRTRASMTTGRQDESIGAVSVKGLSGDNLANALHKAETKAKRRVTLSICGLGFLDESEVEGLRAGQHPVPEKKAAGAVVDDRHWSDLCCALGTGKEGYEGIWRDTAHPGDDKKKLDDLNDGQIAKLWESYPDSPGINAWRAELLESRAVAKGLTSWGAILTYLSAIEGLPVEFRDCTGEQLKTVAAELK